MKFIIIKNNDANGAYDSVYLTADETYESDLKAGEFATEAEALRTINQNNLDKGNDQIETIGQAYMEITRGGSFLLF